MGVVTDTHVGDALPALPDGVSSAFADVDVIIHAGDVTITSVLDGLSRLAPVVAVQGNHDREAGLDLPTERVVRIGGARIGVTHGLRSAPTEAVSALCGIVAGHPVMAGLPRALARRFTDIDCLVFGHFHVPYLGYAGSTVVFSPGAVYVVEADPHAAARGLKGRAYRRFRSGLPDYARIPHVGILEIDRGLITPRFVPLPSGLRPS